jgi:hypothetical protein
MLAQHVGFYFEFRGEGDLREAARKFAHQTMLDQAKSAYDPGPDDDATEVVVRHEGQDRTFTFDEFERWLKDDK